MSNPTIRVVEKNVEFVYCIFCIRTHQSEPGLQVPIYESNPIVRGKESVQCKAICDECLDQLIELRKES